jgi:heme A synthase
MTAGFLLMLAGIATAMFMRRRRRWLQIHKAAGTLTAICLLCGFASGIVMVVLSAGEHFRVIHPYLGLVATTLAILTAVLGHLQFRVKNASGKIRMYHRWSGRITLVSACTAIASGLQTAGII